jgi:predicted HicB family RNase H-like nuclease
MIKRQLPGLDQAKEGSYTNLHKNLALISGSTMASKLLMIQIDEDLHRRFKDAAAYRQTLMSELLIEFIKKVVEKVQSKKLDIKLPKKL